MILTNLFLMKTSIFKVSTVLLFVILMISCTNSPEKKLLTEDDYKKATAHMNYDLNKLISNKIAMTKWLDQDLFFYSKSVDKGEAYMLVNPETKEKNIAFDLVKLTASLSAKLDTIFNAEDVSLKNVDYLTATNSIIFDFNRKSYTCSLGDYVISDFEKEQQKTSRNDHVSPDKKLAAYIYNYNLWVKDLSSDTKTQLTFDGD